MSAFPILFGYRDLIACRGFFAFVSADGRALLQQERDGTHWLYGVYPGGIAGGGKEIAEAARDLKKRYLSVLFDIAEEALTFEDFKAQVEGFFNDVNDPVARDWEGAHARVKRGQLLLDDLPKIAAETRPPKVEVVLVRNEDAQASQYNTFDDPHYAEAA